MNEARTAFDRAAPNYDRDFPPADPAVRLFRDAIHERLARHFPAGARVLDLGCGTGEDTVWLAERGHSVVAVDLSRAMLQAARVKMRERGLGNISFVQGSASAIPSRGDFGGLVSSFGPLNCENDLPAVARDFARLLAPGACAVLTPMARVCPWEIAQHLAHGRPLRATARLWRRDADVAGVRVPVRYPSVRAWRRLFEDAGLQLVEARALGALVPAPGLAARLPRPAFDALAAIERLAGASWPLRLFGDHHLLVIQRPG